MFNRILALQQKNQSRLAITLSALAASMLMTACGTPGPYLEETNYVDQTGAFQLVDRKNLEQVNLAELLVKYAPKGNEKDGCSDTDLKDEKNSENINWAGGCFNKRARAAIANNAVGIAKFSVQKKTGQATGDARDTANDAVLARNALQERLLAASVQRCNAFKAQLQRTSSRVNFNLGLASTIAGTVGALVDNTANAWAGASAIFSGARAEYNQDYMASLAAYVIVDGIDRTRRDVYEQIIEKGQKMSYEAYPVEAAVKDALYYHGLCSVMTGFKVAQSSIREAEEPGMSSSLRTLAKLKIANNLYKKDVVTTSDILAETKKMAEIDVLLAGTRSNGAGGAEWSVETFFSLREMTKKTDASLNDAVAELGKTIDGDAALKELADKNKKKLDAAKAAYKEAESLNQPLLSCRDKYKALVSAEEKSNEAALSAKREPEVAKHKNAAKAARQKIGEITMLFSALVNEYVNVGDTSVEVWKAKLTAAKEADKDKKEAAFGEFVTEYEKRPALDAVALKELKDVKCK